MNQRRKARVKEKRLVDANHFEQVLKNIACALKGELTYGKIKIDVVKLIMGSLEAEPTITAESLQPLTYNEIWTTWIATNLSATSAESILRTGSESRLTRMTGRRTLRVHV